jgi:exosortase/archaeosortase family protein
VGFALLFLLFALPPPVRVRLAFQAPLQEATATCAAAVLPLLGIPVERNGFVLRLPSGELGVVEACSGVRSVTAVVAVAALVAHVRGFGVLRGVVFVLLALPVVALANAVRVALSGVLQEALGPWVHEGAAHEALGVVTLLAGLAGVLALSHGLRPRQREDRGQRTEDSEETSSSLSSVLCPLSSPSTPPARGGWVAAGLLATALIGSAATWAGGQLARTDDPSTRPEAVACTIGLWRGVDEPIDPKVSALLGSDQAVHRIYRNAAGQPVHVWVIYWSSANVDRVYFHHPDVCWPNRGWAAVDCGRREIPLPAAPCGNSQIPNPKSQKGGLGFGVWDLGVPGAAGLSVAVRRFERNGQQQVVYYWVKTGRLSGVKRTSGGRGPRRQPTAGFWTG